MSGPVGNNPYRASGVVAAAGGGGVSWQDVITASTFTAEAGNGYPVNTTSNACTVTLPAAASVGDEIIFTDYARNFDTNALTIDQNSLNFQGNATPNPVYDTAGESIHIVYQDATKGWLPLFDGAVAFETPQSYDTEWLCIAGGGGSGQGYADSRYQGGGPGGAGGYRLKYASESSGGGTDTESVINLVTGVVITATIGGGGAAAPGNHANGSKGTDSSIAATGLTTITSEGGGHGSGDRAAGGAGGSGGGAGSGTGTPGGTDGYPGGAGTSNQGYAGGSSLEWPSGGGGGGGGASAVGENAESGGAEGGAGLSGSITGSAVGRGGGGAVGPSGTATDGGGPGGATGVAGTANTGGGGGSGGATSAGGAGGSGVVILRMLTADYSGSTTGSPTVGTDGLDTVITFNATGTYTT